MEGHLSTNFRFFHFKHLRKAEDKIALVFPYVLSSFFYMLKLKGLMDLAGDGTRRF